MAKQMKPLYGESYMRFLQESAARSDAWPRWIVGETNRRSTSSSSLRQQEMPKEKSSAVHTKGAKFGSD